MTWQGHDRRAQPSIRLLRRFDSNMEEEKTMARKGSSPGLLQTSAQRRAIYQKGEGLVADGRTTQGVRRGSWAL